MRSEDLVERHSIGDLIKAGVITAHKDGNFGSLYPRIEDFVDNGIPLLTAKVVNAGRIDFEAAQKLSKETAARLTYGFIQAGDVLLSHNATVGRVAVVPEFNGQALIGTSLTYFRPDKSRLLPRYLASFLESRDFQNQLAGVMGLSTRNQVPITAQRLLEVDLPPMPVQRRISEFVGALDDRITVLRETNATVEAIAQALFKSWFVDFDPVRAKLEGSAPEGMDEATARLFPDSFEESELGLVPRGWRAGTLSDLAEFQNGYAFKSKDWVVSGHPVVKIGDVKPGIIDFSGCSFVAPETTVGLDRFQLNRGDLLVGMTGYVGETGLVAEVAPAAYLNQRVGRIATADGMKDGGFVYCLVRAAEFKAYAVAQSHGSAQANVSGSALLNYPSIIPTADVRAHFNDLAHPVLESILSNHEQAQTLATLRDTLLPRLISGQLRLPEAQAAAEEALA
jgi:type I restriction enzyme S subunit